MSRDEFHIRRESIMKILPPGIYKDVRLGGFVKFIGPALNPDTQQILMVVHGDIGLEVHKPAEFEQIATFKTDAGMIESTRFVLERC